MSQFLIDPLLHSVIYSYHNPYVNAMITALYYIQPECQLYKPCSLYKRKKYTIPISHWTGTEDDLHSIKYFIEGRLQILNVELVMNDDDTILFLFPRQFQVILLLNNVPKGSEDLMLMPYIEQPLSDPIYIFRHYLNFMFSHMHLDELDDHEFLHVNLYENTEGFNEEYRVDEEQVDVWNRERCSRIFIAVVTYEPPYLYYSFITKEVLYSMMGHFSLYTKILGISHDRIESPYVSNDTNDVLVDVFTLYPQNTSYVFQLHIPIDVSEDSSTTEDSFS